MAVQMSFRDEWWCMFRFDFDHLGNRALSVIDWLFKPFDSVEYCRIRLVNAAGQFCIGPVGIDLKYRRVSDVGELPGLRHRSGCFRFQSDEMSTPA